LDKNISIKYCLEWLQNINMYTDLEINWVQHFIDETYKDTEEFRFKHQGITNRLCLVRIKKQVCLSLAQYSVSGVVIDITKTRECAEKREKRIMEIMRILNPPDFIIG